MSVYFNIFNKIHLELSFIKAAILKYNIYVTIVVINLEILYHYMKANKR